MTVWDGNDKDGGNDGICLPHLIFLFHVLYSIRLAARGKIFRKVGNT